MLKKKSGDSEETTASATNAVNKNTHAMGDKKCLEYEETVRSTKVTILNNNLLVLSFDIYGDYILVCGLYN